MTTYIEGHYFTEDKEIDVLKDPLNRKILKTLREEYPKSRTAQDLKAEIGLQGSISPIHRELKSLEEKSFIIKLKDKRKEKRNGRTIKPSEVYIIEDINTVLKSQFPSQFPYPLAPGNVKFSKDFENGWKRIANRLGEEPLYKEELTNAFTILRRYIGKILELTEHERDEAVKKIAPDTSEKRLCPNCGFNHEARDFIRSVLLNLIDRLETNAEFIKFLKGKNLMTDEAFNKMMELSRSLTIEEKSKEITKLATTHGGSAQLKKPSTEVAPSIITLRILCIQKDIVRFVSIAPPSEQVIGSINSVISYASAAGCIVVINLPTDRANALGLEPGELILLFSEKENFLHIIIKNKFSNR